MSEPKPFTVPAPTVATEIPAKRESSRANRGPNFFLEPRPDEGFPEGWLAKSFDDATWYEVALPGVWEEGEVLKGERKGEPITRLTGDAQEATRQLREAADALGIGVSIKYFPVLYKGGAKKGQEVPGMVLIKYLGQARKQRREKATEE